jgi:hypothetical protein
MDADACLLAACFVVYLLDDDDAGDVMMKFLSLPPTRLSPPASFFKSPQKPLRRVWSVYFWRIPRSFFVWDDSFVRQLFVLIDASKSPTPFFG